MKCEEDIIELATTKMAEAECLLNNRMPDGAYYLAGYCVELVLKARICKMRGIPDFFDFDSESKKKLKNEANITRPYKVHDLEQLMLLAGLSSQFEIALQDDDFKDSWAIISKWNENVRYETGQKTTQVQLFVTSIKELMAWIQKYL